MKTDGPGKLNLAGRLKASTAEELAEAEDATRILLDAHADALNALSKNALARIETSITSQIDQIETVVAARKETLSAEIEEITAGPLKMMRRVAITSAAIGALIAMIPWGVMSYMGMSVTSETLGQWERIQAIRDQEARIAALKGIALTDIGAETVLMLPASVTRLYSCGTDQTPCIKISE